MGNVFVEANEVKKDGRLLIHDLICKINRGDKQRLVNHILKGQFIGDLESDLSNMAGKEGRHPMPSEEQLKNLFETAGLTLEDTIYVYDQGASPFAARAWWMLKYADFPNVYIVNGGMNALVDAGFEVASEVKQYPKTTLELNWNEVDLCESSRCKKYCRWS